MMQFRLINNFPPMRFTHAAKTMKLSLPLTVLASLVAASAAAADLGPLDAYNVVWTTQSKGSRDSMPCGGGDVGCNVWVENGEVLFYISRSGTFDENNTMLKLGRVRLRLTPNSFAPGGEFRQELKLRRGCVEITGKADDAAATVTLWAEVFRPVIHVDVRSDAPVAVEANYESRRTTDRQLSTDERMQCLSFLQTTPEQFKVVTRADRFETFGPKGDSPIEGGGRGTGPCFRPTVYRKTYIIGRKMDQSPAAPGAAKIGTVPAEILWYHRNDNSDLVFDKEVTQQHLDAVREQLWNPQKDLTFGGLMRGEGMAFAGTSKGRYMDTDFQAWRLRSESPAKEHRLKIFLHTAQAETIESWKSELRRLADAASPSDAEAWAKNLDWWREFWDRSYIYCRTTPSRGQSHFRGDKNSQANNAPAAAKIGTVPSDCPPESDPVWRVGRDYQLFRYMLGCNAYGEYPSKFNGSLFTVDGPPGTTPDFRFWGGGSFTAQNQRLVYWPMLRSGDFDMMPPQFELYRRALANAELRTKVYWGHAGASFTEHQSSYGLAIGRIYDTKWGEYGLEPRPGDDPGRLLNPWCEDQYDTVLEFCLMVLDLQRYTGQDVSKYIPMVESCVRFFDEHYQYQCRKRTGKPLDENGHLVIYPGTACETYKLAVNPAPTVAALRTVLERMLELPDEYALPEKRREWTAMLGRVPPLSFRDIKGHKTIAPAKSWQRINNAEFPQLYPVYPYGIYGLGKPDLQTAIDTWRYGADRDNQRRNHCWYQSGIFCARLGLVDESAKLLLERYGCRARRFPVFWENRNFCECPDFDHGGVAMIHLQESLLQTDGRSIRMLPAWPKDWDVDFKLRAPYETIVRCKYINGELSSVDAAPKSRAADVVYPDFETR